MSASPRQQGLGGGCGQRRRGGPRRVQRSPAGLRLRELLSFMPSRMSACRPSSLSPGQGSEVTLPLRAAPQASRDAHPRGCVTGAVVSMTIARGPARPAPPRGARSFFITPVPRSACRGWAGPREWHAPPARPAVPAAPPRCAPLRSARRSRAATAFRGKKRTLIKITEARARFPPAQAERPLAGCHLSSYTGSVSWRNHFNTEFLQEITGPGRRRGRLREPLRAPHRRCRRFSLRRLLFLILAVKGT